MVSFKFLPPTPYFGVILKTFPCLTLSIILLLSLTLIGNIRVDFVQAYEGASGIISADTTWTKANSPYNLTGNLLLDKGVTLAIESGVTVNLGSYYIRVNGTLIAKGTDTDKIRFNGRSAGIQFTLSSTCWNGQTNSGSIIENSILDSGLLIDGGSPLISKNTINKEITITGGSSIISKNTITGHNVGAAWRSDTYGIFIEKDNAAFIVDNTISGFFSAAAIQIGNNCSSTILRNRISNEYDYGSTPEEITGYNIAAVLIYQANSAHPLIEHNTITKSAIGMSISGSSNAVIRQNNILENSYNLHLSLGTKSNIVATNNWWGTTDTAVIDQKIYDYNDDFNLGKVNYTPFLTSANPQAVPDPNAPIPTPNISPTETTSSAPTTSASPFPSQNPTTSPDLSGSQAGAFFGLDWVQFATLSLLAVVVVLLVVVVVFLRKRSVK